MAKERKPWASCTAPLVACYFLRSTSLTPTFSKTKHDMVHQIRFKFFNPSITWNRRWDDRGAMPSDKALLAAQYALDARLDWLLILVLRGDILSVQETCLLLLDSDFDDRGLVAVEWAATLGATLGAASLNQ